MGDAAGCGRHHHPQAFQRLPHRRRQAVGEVRVPAVDRSRQLHELVVVGLRAARRPALHGALGRLQQLSELPLAEPKRALRFENELHVRRMRQLRASQPPPYASAPPLANPMAAHKPFAPPYERRAAAPVEPGPPLNHRMALPETRCPPGKALVTPVDACLAGES